MTMGHYKLESMADNQNEELAIRMDALSFLSARFSNESVAFLERVAKTGRPVQIQAKAKALLSRKR